MKKKLLIAVAVMVVLTLVCMAGCSLFNGTSADTAANNSTGTNVTTYTDVSKTDLEEALTKYREIAENLSTRVSELEELVRQSIVTSKSNIGAYAVTYVDCVMSLQCTDERYIVDATTNAKLGCQGTGFVITEDGYVITNNHVVIYENTQVVDTSRVLWDPWLGSYYGTKIVSGEYPTIKGTFDSTSIYYSDGKSYSLQLIYRDPAYDLALCKLVEDAPVGEAWKPIPFYEGAVVRGDELLLLGNAKGFGLSATSGLISATGKTFSDFPQLTFIQTDAAINGGNSGGPAINIYGGLVGVVNSKFVSTNIENMGFAIELSKVKEFIAAAQTNASVTVAYKTISASSSVTNNAA